MQATSERDALIEALELAQKDIAQAQGAQREADGKIALLLAQMDTQYVRLVFLQSRLEKMGLATDRSDAEQDEQIKLLESQCGECLAENERLKELLDENTAEKVPDPAPETALGAVMQKEPPPLDEHAPIEIEASPRLAKRTF